MKIFNTALFRAFVAIIAGGLMIQYREQMVTWLTVCIGVLFFISGVVSILAYYVGKNKAEKAIREAELKQNGEEAVISTPTFPIVGIGSAFLGIILCFMPTTFISYLVYIFAAIIILGAIGQYTSLISTINAIRDYKAGLKSTNLNTEDAPKIPHCGYLYWIIPTVLLLFGIYAILDPISIVSAPFLFIGIAMVVYGFAEVVNAIKFHSVHKTIAKGTAAREELKAIVENDNDITDAEIVSEASTPDNKQ